MRSLKTFLCAMMLVLMLWAGGVAHAAEQVCIPATEEAAGHYEGDGDQLPSDQERGTAHHHTGCSGHNLVAPAKGANAPVSYSAAPRDFPLNETGPPSHDPDSQLRPPIA